MTVWYPRGALTGSWERAAIAVWVQQLYEYLWGVPATVEYEKE